MNGVDFEYMFTPSLHNDIKFSAGYIDAKDKNSIDVAGISNLLLDLEMRYSINKNFNVAALIKYASPFKREKDDIRDDLTQKAKADLTASYKLDGITVSIVALTDNFVGTMAETLTIPAQGDRTAADVLPKLKRNAPYDVEF